MSIVMYRNVPSFARFCLQPGCRTPPFGKKFAWPASLRIPKPTNPPFCGMSVSMTSTYLASLGSNRKRASPTSVKRGPAGSNPKKRKGSQGRSKVKFESVRGLE